MISITDNQSYLSMALILLLLLSVFASPATANLQLYHLCFPGNFTSNSPYSSNLNLLLFSLFSNASSKGFASFTAGKDSNRVYGLAFCRGDTNITNCSSCISAAITGVQTWCPNNKGGAVWYDYCQLFYDDQDIVNDGDVTNNYQYVLVNPNKVSGDTALRFQNLTVSLIQHMSDLAVRNKSRFFATGETVLNATNTFYGLVQCALDLTVSQCQYCLQVLVGSIWVDDRKLSIGRRAMGYWCNMEYDIFKFYDGKSMLQISTTNMSTPNTTHSPTNISSGGIALETVYDALRQKKLARATIFFFIIIPCMELEIIS